MAVSPALSLQSQGHVPAGQALVKAPEPCSCFIVTDHHNGKEDPLLHPRRTCSIPGTNLIVANGNLPCPSLDFGLGLCTVSHVSDEVPRSGARAIFLPASSPSASTPSGTTSSFHDARVSLPMKLGKCGKLNNDLPSETPV